MDPRDLDGKTVVAVLFQSEAPEVGYIRGVAAWNGGELRVFSEKGQVYPVPATFACGAQAITRGVRETVPAAMRAILASAEFVIPIPPPSGGNIALAVTPSGPVRLPPNDR